MATALQRFRAFEKVLEAEGAVGCMCGWEKRTERTWGLALSCLLQQLDVDPGLIYERLEAMPQSREAKNTFDYGEGLAAYCDCFKVSIVLDVVADILDKQ